MKLVYGHLNGHRIDVDFSAGFRNGYHPHQPKINFPSLTSTKLSKTKKFLSEVLKKRNSSQTVRLRF